MQEGEEDVSLEWLSIYVEDCLSGSTSYSSHPLPPPTTISHDVPPPKPPTTTKTSSSSFQDLAIPAKARTKRRRVTTPKELASQDPLLFHQTCWLADSELILPKKEQENKAPAVELLEGEGGEAGERMEKEQQQQQQIRRCTHCLSHKTPQWRAGPLGPKTLCNACGVRFKSGRLLPEYRPAKSPTFVSYKHSNSHKKVMEMRMMAILPSQSN
ncbi:GATA transcription factor 2 [Cocos nucifera]|nr:GATA transcription factor 2 [Cocos nucifera]